MATDHHQATIRQEGMTRAEQVDRAAVFQHGLVRGFAALSGIGIHDVSLAQRPWPADKVERWAIDRLIPYAKNARTHTDAKVAARAASIKEWGWTTPALVGEDLNTEHHLEEADYRAFEELLCKMCNEPNPVLRFTGKTDEHGWSIFERIPSVQDQPKGTA